MLGPTTPYATVKHGDFTYVGYTGIFNVLDYSACSFPTGLTVNAEVDTQYHDSEPLSPFDEPVRKKCEYWHYNSDFKYPDYVADNPKDVHNMPISLQLVARRLEEEKLLSMLEAVLKAL